MARLVASNIKQTNADEIYGRDTTTLFIVAAPISLLAAMRYYREDYVNVKAGLIVMVAFFLFSLFGAHVAVHMPGSIL